MLPNKVRPRKGFIGPKLASARVSARMKPALGRNSPVNMSWQATIIAAPPEPAQAVDVKAATHSLPDPDRPGQDVPGKWVKLVHMIYHMVATTRVHVRAQLYVLVV